MDAYEADLFDEWVEEQMHAHHAITPHWSEQEAAHADDEDPFAWQYDHIYRDEPFDPWADFAGVAAADSVIDRWFDRIRY
ncbi:MAG: hypothetical protein QM753_08795 [Thermomicrobiales bacterium]